MRKRMNPPNPETAPQTSKGAPARALPEAPQGTASGNTKYELLRKIGFTER